MPKHIQLEYGKGSCEFSVPADRFLGTLMPQAAKPLSDLSEALSQSFAQPVDDAPLEEKLQGVKSMLILTVDITRPSPTPIPGMLNSMYRAISPMMNNKAVTHHEFIILTVVSTQLQR